MEDRAISLNILDAKYNQNVSIEQAKKYLYAKIDGLSDDEYNTFSKIIDDMYNELPPVTPSQEDLDKYHAMGYREGYKQALSDHCKSLANGDRAISLNAVLDALEMSYLKSEIDDLTYQRIKELPPVIPQFYPPCEDCNKKMNEIRKAYDKLQDRPTGHWIKHLNSDKVLKTYQCSNCGCYIEYKQKFCEECGCRMIGEEDER